jgi:RNA polymerase sigma-70 factor, ECF subfamily
MSDDLLDHIPALRPYARSLCGNKADADDLVQETLVRAIEYVSSYRDGTNMRAWLFTIMRNRFFTNARKRARENTGAAECVSHLPNQSAQQEWHVAGKELAQAVEELPVHYREALVLVVVLGETYIDASRILSCDIGTIKSRVNRARSKIKTALGEVG